MWNRLPYLLEISRYVTYYPGMFYFISELFLFFHFSIIFSLTVLCVILYIKTKDTLIKNFLFVLLPLLIYTFIAFLYYFGSDAGIQLPRHIESALSLYTTIIVVLSIVFFARGVSRYLVALLSLEEKSRKLAYNLINTGSFLFFLFSIFFIFLLASANWEYAFFIALNRLFVYSSLVLILPTIVASVYLQRREGSVNYRLLSGIMIAFYPLLLFAPLDALFFMESPFKLVDISYSLFSFFVYFFVVRHYIYNYEPDTESMKAEIDTFYETYDISKREREIINQLLTGKSNKEIAAELYISYNTVKTHVKNIYRKLDVANRIQLIHKIKITQRGD